MIIKPETYEDHPGWPATSDLWQNKPHRPDDMACIAQQYFTFAQRFSYQSEGVVFEIAKPAVDQLTRGRGRAISKVIFLDQQDREITAGSIARDHYAVDATTDDEDIVSPVLHVALVGFAAASPLLQSAGPKTER